MEWVETTAKSLDEAKEHALDQLGVAADEAEFDVLEEPRSGLFGRTRGEARVRARVRPTAVRPKQDRRNRRSKSKQRPTTDGDAAAAPAPERSQGAKTKGSKGPKGSTKGSTKGSEGSSESRAASPSAKNSQGSKGAQGSKPSSNSGSPDTKEQRMDTEEQEASVAPQEVGDAAVSFMSGLVSAFGAEAETELDIDGTEIDVRVVGDELGLLVGPGGRTLTAVQDLARVASQRRLGDHDTRLRIDVGGYREKRRTALEKFAVAVAHEVIESGETKALEPMSSADRKIVHDAVIGVEGATSRSEGDEPRRRVVITPA